MKVEWTGKAVSDLARLHDFLAAVDRNAAARTIRTLVAAPLRLVEYPRLGDKIDEFAPRDVRGLLVGRYEMRYELLGETISVMRFWHTRESR